jgi:hypothetical protein
MSWADTVKRPRRCPLPSPPSSPRSNLSLGGAPHFGQRSLPFALNSLSSNANDWAFVRSPLPLGRLGGMLRGARHRIASSRVRGSPRRSERAPCAPDPLRPCPVLKLRAHPGRSGGAARSGERTRRPDHLPGNLRTPPPLRAIHNVNRDGVIGRHRYCQVSSRQRRSRFSPRSWTNETRDGCGHGRRSGVPNGSRSTRICRAARSVGSRV